MGVAGRGSDQRVKVLRKGGEESAPDRQRRCRCAGRDAELGPNGRSVIGDGGAGDAEDGGNLLVGQSLDQETQHLPLAGGQG